jgi:hypothetical protein
MNDKKTLMTQEISLNEQEALAAANIIQAEKNIGHSRVAAETVITLRQGDVYQLKIDAAGGINPLRRFVVYSFRDGRPMGAELTLINGNWQPMVGSFMTPVDPKNIVVVKSGSAKLTN